MDNTKVFESADFLESLLRHLALCPEVMEKAQASKLVAEDFVIDDIVGIKIYREFARIILMLGVAPVSDRLFLTYLKATIDNGVISSDQTEAVANLYNFIFNDSGPLSPEFVSKNLVNFMRYRRILKAKIQNKEDIDKLVLEYNQINKAIASLEASKVIRTFSPFETLALKADRNSVIPTGLTAIDSQIRGHGKGELGFIIGFNGGGKTSLCCRIARGSAEFGHRSLIVELEEPGENIANRLYSAVFKIPYTDLHKEVPGAREQLVQCFNEMDPILRRTMMNIQIADLRDIESTCDSLKDWLEQRSVETGFYPDQILIDQKSFLHPNSKIDPAKAQWEGEARVAHELKGLAEYKIAGQWDYALWCLSQAKGDPKMQFNRSQLSGYKEILQPSTLALGVGKDANNDRIMSIFSLKSRHTMAFSFKFNADLGFMEISNEDTKPMSSSDSAPTSNPHARRQQQPTAAPPSSPPGLQQMTFANATT
jgi:hypothetical protein